MEKLLYVDDIRKPNIIRYSTYSYEIIVSRNYDDVINMLNMCKFNAIDLDHDLGEEKTGYDICKYIIENNIKLDRVYIHTSNPLGKDNMKQLLERYTDNQIIIY